MQYRCCQSRIKESIKGKGTYTYLSLFVYAQMKQEKRAGTCQRHIPVLFYRIFCVIQKEGGVNELLLLSSGNINRLRGSWLHETKINICDVYFTSATEYQFDILRDNCGVKVKNCSAGNCFTVNGFNKSPVDTVSRGH